MSSESNDSSARRRRVDEVIAAYLEAADAGESPAPEEFISQHTDLRDELVAFFANHDQLKRLAMPLRAVTNIPDEQLVVTPDSSEKSSESSAKNVSISTTTRQFGDFELLEEIARGGMGVVYKARQISLDRIVALKMILAGQLASEEEVKRFHAEAEAAANLDHPGIVPIYEVGEHDGQHYFSMGHVDGHSLATRLREGPLASRTAAILLRQVCEAVQYAHEHDVIHRDLKPANILLPKDGDRSTDEESGEAQHDSGTLVYSRYLQPRITDFGLAKRLTTDSNLTGTGQILGTPSYMSPEQAAGAAHHVGPASDVYSLGAILYQLMTARPPFQAETPLDTLTQLLDSDPVPPRLLNRNVPRDLEAICMKCLEREPTHRYASARELGDDLDRYLKGETIHASGVNLLDRVTRVLRQSRHEEHFRGWGVGLMAVGLVIFLSHVAIFLLERSSRDPWTTYFLPRSVMFATLLIMFWRFRNRSVLPTKSAERLVWVVWIGYLLALGAVNAARSVFGHDQRESYAFFAVLTGFGFLIMGGHVWGGGYVVGLVFMIAAPLLAMNTALAPLAFGALWAGALLTFGFHYWCRGRAAETSVPGATTTNAISPHG